MGSMFGGCSVQKQLFAKTFLSCLDFPGRHNFVPVVAGWVWAEAVLAMLSELFILALV